MKKKRLVALLCAVCLYFSCVSLPSVLAADAPLKSPPLSSAAQASVTRYQQEKSLWCWVACIKMVVQHMLGSSPSQSQIYKNGKYSNTVANEAATNDELTRGLNVSLNSKYFADHAGGTKSIDWIKGCILVDKPLIFKLWWSGRSGHAVVIDAYSLNKIRVVDPWYNCTSKVFVDYDDAKTKAEFPSGTYQWVDTWSISDTPVLN